VYLAEPNALYFSILIPFVTHVFDTHKTHTCNASNNIVNDKGVLKLVWKSERELCRLDRLLDRLLSTVTFWTHNFGLMTTDRQDSKQFHSFTVITMT
jgi:hypothetical protein